jgi:hypothetical protein
MLLPVHAAIATTTDSFFFEASRHVQDLSIYNVSKEHIDLNLRDLEIHDALYRLIYYSKSALHVSGDVLSHHQEHLTVFTVSGSVHPGCCRLVSRMS